MATIGVFAAIMDPADRVLCVRQRYGHQVWTTPGGRVEDGEALSTALLREVREETGLFGEIGELVGVYHKPYCNDLVVCFEVHIVGGTSNVPNEEISEQGFFELRSLPSPMAINTRQRITDGLRRARGVVRVFASEHAEAQPSLQADGHVFGVPAT